MHGAYLPTEDNDQDLLQDRAHELVNDFFDAEEVSKQTLPLPIALPEPGLQLEQDAEWFLVKTDGNWRQMRFHDYGAIYRLPGLYERLFYDILKCDSPAVLRRALLRQLNCSGVIARELRVLDLGAGNGMVGERMAQLDVEWLVGADILEEAAHAASRDRPNVYDQYLVLDFTQVSEAQQEQLLQQRFNCLTCVAALGFGDIPAVAFASAYNVIEDGGWIAFTIKEEFVLDRSRSPFARLIDVVERSGALRIISRDRYRHRFSTGGAPLHYICFIGRKQGQLDNASLFS